MIERERARERNRYEENLERDAARRRRALTGKVVVKPSDREWSDSRQGRSLAYLHGWALEDTAIQNWRVFVRDQRAHSGKHRHQGGLVIYVIEGEGYTVIDGEKLEWQAGDLLLLPIKPGGVEHQHFSKDPSKPTRWMAFIYEPFWYAGASTMQHISGEADLSRLDR